MNGSLCLNTNLFENETLQCCTEMQECSASAQRGTIFVDQTEKNRQLCLKYNRLKFVERLYKIISHLRSCSHADIQENGTDACVVLRNYCISYKYINSQYIL